MTSCKVSLEGVTRKEKKEKTYPWVGYWEPDPRCVVFFTSYRKGFYITVETSEDGFGKPAVNILEHEFKPYVGKIIINCEE